MTTTSLDHNAYLRHCLGDSHGDARQLLVRLSLSPPPIGGDTVTVTVGEQKR
jgi:hypothetical protein